MRTEKSSHFVAMASTIMAPMYLGLLLPLTSMSPFPGPYTLQAVELQLDVVFTNATPTSPIRGAGRPYAAFVIERAVDRIAQHMKIDRAEIRRRNFVQPTQMPYPTGMLYRDGSIITYDSGDYPACLEKALEMADYEGFPSRRAEAQKQGRALGIGIASYIEDTGVGPYEGEQFECFGRARFSSKQERRARGKDMRLCSLKSAPTCWGSILRISMFVRPIPDASLWGSAQSAAGLQ